MTFACPFATVGGIGPAFYRDTVVGELSSASPIEISTTLVAMGLVPSNSQLPLGRCVEIVVRVAVYE